MASDGAEKQTDFRFFQAIRSSPRNIQTPYSMRRISCSFSYLSNPESRCSHHSNSIE